MKKISLALIVMTSILRCDLALCSCADNEIVVEVVNDSEPLITNEIANIDNPTPSATDSLSVLTFDEAVSRLLIGSPRLRISAAEIGIQNGERIQAGLYPNPDLDYSVENICGNKSWRGWRAAESRYGVAELIELGNKRGIRACAAKYRYYAAQWGYEATQLTLLNKLSHAFLEVMANQELLKIAEEQVAVSEEIFNTVYAKVENGKASVIQLNKAEIAYSEAIIAFEQAQASFALAKENLSILWGCPCPDFKCVEYPLYAIEQPKSYQECWCDVTSNPELMQAQFDHLAAQHNYKLQKAATIPDVTVIVGIKTEQECHRRGLLFGASVPLPLFDRNQGNICSAKAEVERKRDLYLELELYLQNKLSLAHRELVRAYKEASRISSHMLKFATSSLQLAGEGYREGKLEYLEMLDSQRTLFQVQEQYIYALLNYHQRLTDIEYLNSQVD